MMGTKYSPRVASSIATKSERAMIEALIDGERCGTVPGRTGKAKIPDLAMALEGRFADHHALMCRLHLDHIDHLEAMLVRLDAHIEAMMTPPPAPGHQLARPGHRQTLRRARRHSVTLQSAAQARLSRRTRLC
jgi:transposase